MIVITGGTGFVGEEIVKQARAAGFPVRMIVRELPPGQWLADRYGVELFHGNVLFAPSLEGAMQGANCVIHLVGIIHEQHESTFERAHAQATKFVVDETKRAGVKRYLHMSALGTRENARSRYHQTKWAAEEYVRKSGLAWTIFRPSVIYGPKDRSVNTLMKVIRRLPFVPVLGPGTTKIQPISVENVAKAFVAAIRNDNSIGKTYDLCGPEAFPWNELYDRLQQLLGSHKPKLHLPLPIARLQAAFFEKILPQPPFTRDQLLMLQEDNVGNPEPATREFTLAHKKFEEGVAPYLKNGA
ncbi:MAG TPA: complex I NDUFA9 subunit family protein [Verrucomicrobiae bacterium]|nr:complex I NDUFA9 subunit family protein [Verrucomicrobiae bacterium]